MASPPGLNIGDNLRWEGCDKGGYANDNIFIADLFFRQGLVSTLFSMGVPIFNDEGSKGSHPTSNETGQTAGSYQDTDLLSLFARMRVDIEPQETTQLVVNALTTWLGRCAYQTSI